MIFTNTYPVGLNKYRNHEHIKKEETKSPDPPLFVPGLFFI